jgi:hypothetical protein
MAAELRNTARERLEAGQLGLGGHPTAGAHRRYRTDYGVVRL